MKRTILLVMISLISSFAYANSQCPPDISKACYNDFKDLGHNIAVEKCSNVAGACYSDYIHFLPRLSTRDACFNVSATCYKEVRNRFRTRGRPHSLAIAKAKNICENVNTNCYNLKRDQGFTLRESVKICFDNYYDCNLCSDL